MQIIDGSQQLELDPRQGYLNKGYIVTITGSKYFWPSLGALLLPKGVSKLIHSVSKVQEPNTTIILIGHSGSVQMTI
jgi:hypothetical protein